MKGISMNTASLKPQEWLFSTAIVRIDILAADRASSEIPEGGTQVAAEDIIDTVSISGTCLNSVATATKFILTTSTVLSKYYRPDNTGNIASNMRIIYATQDEIGSQEVVFSALQVVCKKPLKAINSYIRRFIQNNKGSFFFPNSGNEDIHDDIDIFVLTADQKPWFTSHRLMNSTGQLINFLNLLPSNNASIYNSTSISIISTPFGLVNPALFCGHLSHGIISYVHRETNEAGPLVIFSNVKYLDGMEGGLVVLNRNKDSYTNTLASIGLLMGKLRMENGGELSIIAPWHQILEVLSKELPISIDFSLAHEIRESRHFSMMENLNKVWSQFFFADLNFTNPGYVSHQTWNSTLDLNVSSLNKSLTVATENNYTKSVVLICIKYKAANSWGSGILLDTVRSGDKSILTIVTNAHVIHGNPHEIKVFFQSGVVSSKVKIWNKPFDGIDMLFLKVEGYNLDQTRSSTIMKPATLASVASLIRGTKVNSVGYGLFMPQVTEPITTLSFTNGEKYPLVEPDYLLQPLVSEGIISSDLSLKIPGKLYTENEAPAILVSSAHCWNGCSGGALFSNESGHLMGLLTSNSRVNQTNEILPMVSFVIPSNIIQYGWEICKKFDQNGKHLDRVLTKTKEKVGEENGRTSSHPLRLDCINNVGKGLLEAGPRIKALWKLQETHQSVLAAKL